MTQPQLSPEQTKQLQERLKNMSPEQIQELQKQQSIFRQIVAGKVQARRVYEDDKVIGILDINPGNPGHTLLITREYYSIMPQIPPDLLGHIFRVAKKISQALLRATGAQGTNIVVANGIAAGQKAQDFIVHIIPRKENDGISFTLPQHRHDENVLETMRHKLAVALGYEKGVSTPPQQIPEQHLPVDSSHDSFDSHVKKDDVDLDDISKLLGG